MLDTLCHLFIAKFTGSDDFQMFLTVFEFCFAIVFVKEHLAIRRIFSLVDMITNTKFSNCPNVFEIGVVWQ